MITEFILFISTVCINNMIYASISKVPVGGGKSTYYNVALADKCDRVKDLYVGSAEDNNRKMVDRIIEMKKVKGE